jgi:hypothetical protein
MPSLSVPWRRYDSVDVQDVAAIWQGDATRDEDESKAPQAMLNKRARVAVAAAALVVVGYAFQAAAPWLLSDAVQAAPARAVNEAAAAAARGFLAVDAWSAAHPKV